MIRAITFPQYEPHVKKHEYTTHYMFIRKYAELNGIEVNVTGKSKKVYCGSSTFFSMLIDDRQVIVDYSDHEPLSGGVTELPYFKFHYNRRTHGHLPNVFPIGPMLDIPKIKDYESFFRLCEERIYSCNTDMIISCQRAYLGAKQRRNHVQQLLKQKYDANADIAFRPGQPAFWSKHRDCLVAVCVPGARNDMMDRGHYEQTALGVCVIAPPISTHLPFDVRLMPGKHYVQCRPDYSDLIEQIEWCRENRSGCRKIGENARKLFTDNCVPARYWEWIGHCLDRIK